MPTERLAPDTIAAQANLSGSVGAIQDDPDSPDGSWLTATGNGASDCRVTFPGPSGDPTGGAGLQEFRALVRKNGSGGNAVDWTLELWEGGALVSSLATGTTSSTAGEVIAGTFDASGLGTADGSAVECRVAQTGGDSGNPNGRRYLEIGAVEWNADYQEVVPNHDLGAANGVDAGTPGLGSPGIIQVHALASGELASGAPTLGSAVIGQQHGLAAAGLDAGVPALDSPTAGEGGTDAALTATGIATGAATLGTPVVGGDHALAANGAVAGAASLGRPSLAQIHALVCGSTITGAPILGQPSDGSNPGPGRKKKCRTMGPMGTIPPMGRAWPMAGG